MTDLPQLLAQAWPFVAMLFVGYLVHKVMNAKITVAYEARTIAPDPPKATVKALQKESAERDEANKFLQTEITRLQRAEEMRRGGT